MGAVRFQRSAPFELGNPPAGVKPMTEDEIAKEMESLIRIAPRSWKDLLQQFHGQHYRDVYCAFGQLRPRLGRIVKPPYFPYAFSNSGDFIGEISPAAPSRSADPRKTLQTKSYILMPHDGRYGHEDYRDYPHFGVSRRSDGECDGPIWRTRRKKS
jgi:hypothetical protein